MAGLSMAYALTSALVATRATGLGRDVDTSLFDLARTTPAIWRPVSQRRGGAGPSRSAHPVLTLASSSYRRWLGVHHVQQGEVLANLADILGHPEWAEDPRFKPRRPPPPPR